MCKIKKQNIKNCILILVFAWFFGTLGLLFVYSVPSSSVKIQDAVKTFNIEGPGLQLSEGYLSTRLDNYTDSIMINTASYEGEETLIERALMNYHYEIQGMTSFDSLLLKEDFQQEVSSVNYARYWHGYLVILKPLLCFFEYSCVRFLNVIMQLGLVAWIIVKMYFKGIKKYIIPVLAMYVVLNPVALGKSMQYSTIFYIMVLSVLFLLYHSSFLLKKGYVIYFMLIVGCATSYFDFLTYPIVTLCVPMVFLELLNVVKITTLKERIVSVVCLSGSWGFGYIGMWAGKWLISFVFTGQNIIKDAIISGLYRISNGTSDSGTYEHINSLLSLKVNLSVLNSPIYYLMGFLIVAVIFFGSKHMACGYVQKKTYYLVFVGLLPFLWIMLMCNHSYVHCWMTFRNLAVTVLAWVCAWVQITECFWEKRKEGNE